MGRLECPPTYTTVQGPAPTFPPALAGSPAPRTSGPQRASTCSSSAFSSGVMGGCDAVPWAATLECPPASSASASREASRHARV